MATLTFPKLGPGVLSFGKQATLKDFSARIKSAEVTPEIKDGGGIPLLGGDETNESDATFGTLTAEFYQDFDLDGFVAWTWKHAGKVLDFTFIPQNTGGIKVTGKVRVKPVKLGGEVGKANTTSLSFALAEAMPTIAARV